MLQCNATSTIECVRLTSSNSQIQNKRATKGFILIRHKRYQIDTCLQLSSSIASLVWKPGHFELRSYGDAWHNPKIAFVEKYTLMSWFLTQLWNDAHTLNLKNRLLYLLSTISQFFDFVRCIVFDFIFNDNPLLDRLVPSIWLNFMLYIDQDFWCEHVHKLTKKIRLSWPRKLG